jgi:transposase InsO family protein
LLKFGPNAIADLHLYLDPAERTDEEHQTPCSPCITGKHHRTPFVPSDPGRGGNPLELVHSDLVESHVKSTGGGKWVISFVDHATQFSAVFILPDKNSSTVLNAFKEFQAWAEHQSGCKIKNLRTDRGTEYMGEMIEFVKAQGIDYQPTAGYSPQSNGIAERFNRTLFEKACTMMDAAGAPLHLWADAILAANHILIRLPSSAINGITPFEAWYGHKPTIAHIRKWGCKVYRHIHKKTGRKKFHKKSMLGYLVGYEKGDFYRIYHPTSKAFKISRDTIFDESQFFNTRDVKGSTSTIAVDDGGTSYEENSEVDEMESCGRSDDTPQTIIHDEIVQPPPTSAPPATPPAVDAIPPTLPTAKPPNRCSRRLIVRAFKAMLKGNWKWPRGYKEAMQAHDAEQWELAMQKEYDSILKNKTWDLVPRPKNAKVVKSRWVLRTKDNGVYKARFCAKGFTQQWGEDYDETFAPVAKYTSIRTLLAILAGRKAKVHQMDVNTAFLYSPLDETVYVEQPEGFVIPGKEDYVCLLRRALYGLKQFPRAWFHLIAEVLVDFDFKQFESDPCIWIHENDKGERLYIALYVDDLIIAGENEDEIITIKRRLSNRFEMKDLGIAKKFLGMEIEYGTDGSIKIHQDQYIQQLLERHGMGDCNAVATPLDTSVKLSSIADGEPLADPHEYARCKGVALATQLGVQGNPPG